MALKAGYKGIKEVGPGLDYDNTTGLLKLDGESSLKLDNLEDVNIDTPLGGDVLQYDSSNEEWTNETPDTEPIEDSPQLITSGAVYAGLKTEDDNISAIWSSNARTGVHQLFDLASAKVTAGTGASAEKTSTGVRVYTTSNGTYRKADVVFALPQNADITISGTYTVTSGKGAIGLQYSDDGTTWNNATSDGWTLTGGGETATSASATYKGNTKTHPYFRFEVFCTRATSEAGDVTFADILAKYTVDTDTSITPYAMTNGELTEILTLQESEVTNIVEGATVSTAQGGNHLYRNGKTVQMVLCLEGVTKEGYQTFASVPDGFKPVGTVMCGQTVRSNHKILITSAGSIMSADALSSENINIYGTWITK